MPESHSVTFWIEQLKNGEAEASGVLWERFYCRLVRLAKLKLGTGNRRVADEEDITSIAFAQFFAGVESGLFPRLADREDLWRILLSFVDKRAIDQIRYNSA